jgi:5-methylcytosine-specific restriction protein A
MILTLEIFDKAKSSNGALNKKQHVLLGIPKLYNGWKRDIIGKDYPEEIINQFILLKDDHVIKAIHPNTPLNPNNVILTMELFYKGRSRKGGWNYQQVAVLGEAIPITKGWMKRLVGKECSASSIEQFLALTDAHFGNQKIKGKNEYGDSLKSVKSDVLVSVQYAHPKWKILRNRILYRDDYHCKACGSKAKPLHVHHTVYPQDKFIWEIEDHFLMTLCKSCHEQMHERSFEEIREDLS